jgi:hypothetical protein
MEPTDTPSATAPTTPPTPPAAPRKRAKRIKISTPRAPRVPRQPHKLVVGGWCAAPCDGAGLGNLQEGYFAPSKLQPETPVTEVVDLVAWAQKNCAPGEYDVIRVLPGKLRVAKQETFKAGFEEAK